MSYYEPFTTAELKKELSRLITVVSNPVTDQYLHYYYDSIVEIERILRDRGELVPTNSLIEK